MTGSRIAALVFLFSSLAVWPGVLSASPPAITKTEVYCSGIVSRKKPRSAGYVISGEDDLDKLQFFPGDNVYLRVAAPFSARTGARFLVVRGVKDPLNIPWFRGEKKLEMRMGRVWRDIGRVRVVRTAKGVAIARIETSCAPMQRGDLLVPFRPRPVPSLPASAPPENAVAKRTGRPIGRVVAAKGFRQVLGAGYIAYVNLGTRQGVKVGDRLLLFRHPGSRDSDVYQSTWAETKASGFGHPPIRYAPGQLPREILGEGVVLRVSPTAATVLITSTRREIDLGDYAELE